MSYAVAGSFLQCCTISVSVPRGLPTCLGAYPTWPFARKKDGVITKSHHDHAFEGRPLFGIIAVEIREAEMGLAWMSPALGRNVALDFAEFRFESMQTGLDRLLLCDVGCQHSVHESLVGNSGVA